VPANTGTGGAGAADTHTAGGGNTSGGEAGETDDDRDRGASPRRVSHRDGAGAGRRTTTTPTGQHAAHAALPTSAPAASGLSGRSRAGGRRRAAPPRRWPPGGGSLEAIGSGSGGSAFTADDATLTHLPARSPLPLSGLGPAQQQQQQQQHAAVDNSEGGAAQAAADAAAAAVAPTQFMPPADADGEDDASESESDGGLAAVDSEPGYAGDGQLRDYDDPPSREPLPPPLP
jgi:hypothetical protein